jgi:hypothetical protein
MEDGISDYVVDDANATRLESWLRAGLWTREVAVLLFLEIDPDRVFDDVFSTFSGREEVQYEYFDDADPSSRVPCGVDENGEQTYLTSQQEEIRDRAKESFRRIERVLNHLETAEPQKWIDLACQKGIDIPWFDWALKRDLCIQMQEPIDISNDPVVEGTARELMQMHLLATPQELIAAFGAFTGMDESWFNALKDKPQLKAARKMLGVGGNSSRAPLFEVYPVMKWLIDPKRRTGKPITEDAAWRRLKLKFPKIYEHYEEYAPVSD